MTDKGEKDDDDDEKDDDDDDEKSADASKLDALDDVDTIKKDDAAEEDPFTKLRTSWGFPAFAREFPPDAELARLVAAFAAGDYATVRTGAPALAAKTTDEDVKRAATLLRARIDPDPSSRLFFALTAALMVFLMVWWAAHDGPQHTAPAPPKPAPTIEFVK